MQKINQFLFSKVSSSILAYLRIIMGFSLIYILYKYFHLYFVNNLLHSRYLVTYDFFHWVHPLPIFWFDILFYILYIAAFSMAIGFKYRLNAIIVFLGFTYCFLIDKGHYNNHYYLYSMLLFFFTIIDAHKTFSIDAWLAKRKNPAIKTDSSVPSWQIWIFRLQFFIVYFFGGISKLHLDWLRGYPMRFWLYDNSYDFHDFIGNFLRSEIGALFFSYSGLVFDLLIGFMLLSKRFRRIALLPIIVFHVFNHFLWDIGSFPWMMLLFTPIFFSDSLPKDIVNYVKKNKWKSILAVKQLNPKAIFFFFWPNKKTPLFTSTKKLEPYTANTTKRRKWVSTFFIIWFVLQSLIPLRHYCLKGNPSWTGQGHLFAWRMMLVDTLDAVKIIFKIPETNEEFSVGFEHYFNYKQFKKLTRTPMGILKFTDDLRDDFKEKNPDLDFEIKVIVWKSVNERMPQLLTDTTINYAEYPYEPWKSQACFTDWSETDVAPTFNLEKYANWKRVIELSGEE